MKLYKQNKKKWISKQDFKRYAGSGSDTALLKPISNYVNLSEYNPAILHEFRTKDKKQWMSEQSFLS